VWTPRRPWIPGVACEDNPPPEDLTPAPGYGGNPPPQDPQPPSDRTALLGTVGQHAGLGGDYLSLAGGAPFGELSHERYVSNGRR
jgi:hypothetical protein